MTRLPVRLFASYALVTVVGATAVLLTVRLLTPTLFDHRMQMMDVPMGPGMGPGMGGTPTGGVLPSTRSAFLSALDLSLLVGVLASLLAGGAVAAVVARRLLRPLDQVRATTRRLAAGHYDERVPAPPVPELAALAADVNTLAAGLADTEGRRTRLLGEVGHEMRTPLTAIDGYVEGVMDGVFAPTPQTLGAISDEVRRLRRLADDLSTLSRTEEHRLEIRPADVDLAALARRAVERLQPQFRDAGVTVTAAGPPVPVRADPDRIAQVITNLLGNALAATSPGGRVTVTVTAGADSRQATLTVADTGAGLAGPDLERIFERFYRVPGRPRRGDGSGIGLTIARGIARAHGGDLTARSAGSGRGATFTLRLPTRPDR
jgi:histidine kinase